MITILLIITVIGLTVGSLAYTLHNSFVALDASSPTESGKVLSYIFKAIICQIVVMAIAILALALQ